MPLDMSPLSPPRRVRMIYQTEPSECGLTCVAMIANYHGLKLSMLTLRQQFSLSTRGTSLSTLIEVAQRLGMASQAVKIERHELNQLRLPCVLHLDGAHYVCLTRVGRKQVTILDPAVGERVLGLEQLNRRFDGVALQLWPSEDFKRFRRTVPKVRIGWRGLASMAPTAKRLLWKVLGIALAIEVATCVSPLMTQVVFDRLANDAGHRLVLLVMAASILLCLLSTVLSAARSWLLACIRGQVYVSWTQSIFAHLLSLPQSFFERRKLGDIATRFNAINAIQQTLSTGLIESILGGLLAVITLALMARYGLIFAAISLVAVLLVVVVRMWLYQAGMDAAASLISATSRQQGKVIEAIRAAQAVKVLNAHAILSARFNKTAVDAANATLAQARVSVSVDSVAMLVFGIERMLLLGIGAWLVMDKSLSAGALVALLAYSWQFSQRVTSCLNFWMQVRVLRLQGGRLEDIIAARPEPFTSRLHVGSIGTCRLVARDIGFRYSSADPWILRHCDLELEPGESIAIIGRTGIGKSTLGKVLLGLVDPTEGHVSLDGVDLRTLGKHDWRSRVAAVMQDNELFSGTIAENISMFAPDASIERVEEVARVAGIHDEVMALPLGYRTNIGSVGSTLSSGQRQRIAIARALYQPPRILLMDEATCHLDTVTEGHVLARCKAWGITQIMITHRLDVAARFDRVYELIDGQLKENRPSRVEAPGTTTPGKSLLANA